MPDGIVLTVLTFGVFLAYLSLFGAAYLLASLGNYLADKWKAHRLYRATLAWKPQERRGRLTRFSH